ncbi:MAG TPA: outer membrane lipoprotein carrier protein LolA [Thermoanaerobaculia bacterium]|jgi:outer membrane lipoprotein-sorting protein
MKTLHPTRYRHPRKRRHAIPVLLALAALAVPAAPAPAEDPTELSPWVLLEKLRDDLQRSGPMTSRFVQTYVPAGFSDGDTESGHLAMWLPDCLRWSYEQPQSKSFLVCAGEVYYWSADEPGGRHYKIDAREEPGVDLLLVPVSTLRQRYVAASEKQGDGTYAISLATPPAEDGNFRATIRLDPTRTRVTRLEYADDEGNLTRFALSEYERLSETAVFRPPDGIEWTEE